MTIAGNIYGVVLNDAEERVALAGQFATKPYNAPPVAPVVYMKPLASLAHGPIAAPDEGLVASTTLALLIARDTGGIAEANADACIGAVALALDLALPGADYYRPAVASRNAAGRLAIGTFTGFFQPAAIRLIADGALVHEWSLERLVRPVARLLADLGAFMTIKAGDVLLVGLPGNAPVVHAGQSLRVEADGLPGLSITVCGERA